MSAVLLCRVAGPVELLAVLRPLAGQPDACPVLILADAAMPARVVATATRTMLNAPEQAALARQLGQDPDRGEAR